MYFSQPMLPGKKDDHDFNAITRIHKTKTTLNFRSWILVQVLLFFLFCCLVPSDSCVYTQTNTHGQNIGVSANSKGWWKDLETGSVVGELAGPVVGFYSPWLGATGTCSPSLLFGSFGCQRWNKIWPHKCIPLIVFMKMQVYADIKVLLKNVWFPFDLFQLR